MTRELFDLPLDVLREIPLDVSTETLCSLSFDFVPSSFSGKYLLPFRLLIAGSIFLTSSTFLSDVPLDSSPISIAVDVLYLSVVPVVLMIEDSLEFDSELIVEAWIVPSVLENLLDCADLSRFVLDLNNDEADEADDEAGDEAGDEADDEADDAVVGSSSDLELYFKVPRFVVLWSSVWTNYYHSR